MASDLEAALAKYGYIGTLANMTPELKKILLQAAKEKWAVDKFTRAVQDSKWWKNTADATKQYNVLKATKPGEFAEQQNNTIAKVRAVAAQLGVHLTEGQNGTLAHIVRAAMQHGWDDTTLQTQVAGYWQMVRGKEAGGDVGATTQKLRQVYSSYGIPYSQDSIAKAAKQIITGRGTLDGYVGQALQAAKSRYAALAPQLDQGMTVKDIADPYMSTMASVLEMPEGKVDLNDRFIQQALTARDDKGQPTVKPLWAFEQQLKEDPRWLKTKNGTNATYDILRKIGTDWGFAS